MWPYCEMLHDNQGDDDDNGLMHRIGPDGKQDWKPLISRKTGRDTR